MKRLVLVGLLFVVAARVYGQACTHYVSPQRQGNHTCLAQLDACLMTDIYALNVQGPAVICLTGTDFRTDGRYTGLNSMISPPHPPAPATLAAVAGGGSATVGRKMICYTYLTNGVESSLSFQSSQVDVAANGRLTVAGISVGPAGTTARIIYAVKNTNPFTFGGDWYKLPAAVQALFSGANATNTGATFDPGPDSSWTPIVWPKGFSGSPANHLTIRALNLPAGIYANGAVLIDGQALNAPINYQNGNQYIDMKGILACCSPKTPVAAVLRVGNGAWNTGFYSFGAWNAQPDYNVAIIEVGSDGNYGVDTNVTFDTGFMFGPARKQFLIIGNNGPNLIRRLAYVDTQSNEIGPKVGMSTVYNSYRNTYLDNNGFKPMARQQTHTLKDANGCDIVYPGSAGPCSCPPTPPGCGTLYTGFDVDQPYGLFAGDGVYPGASRQVNTSVHGHVNFVRAGDRIDTHMIGLGFVSTMAYYTLTDSVGVTAQPFPPFYLGNCTSPGLTCPAGDKHLIAKFLTSIGPLPSFIGSEWTPTSNLYLADKSTFDYVARHLCYTHNYDPVAHNSDGTLSTERRFPFPMKAAMMAAMTYAGDTPIDVDAEFVANLGPIPVACNAAPGVTPTATFTNTPTSTPSITPTNTASRTPSSTSTPTATFTPSNTPSRTNTPSNTPTNTYTPSYTPSNTPSNTPSYTPSNTPSNTPTLTPTGNPTATDTPTPTATYTPSNTATYTPSNTPSNTPTYTPSATPTYTPSRTPTPTFTPTVTPGATLSTVFEAESCVAVAPMRIVSDQDASGSAYVDTTVSGAADPAAGGTLTCPFSVPAGTYIVWVRMEAPSASQDSFYVSLDGEAVTPSTHIFDMGQNIDCITNQPDQPDIGPTYFWSKLKDRTTNCFAVDAIGYARLPDLSAGPHTLKFYGREVGARLDKFILTTSLTFDPRAIQRRSGPRPLRLQATPTPKPTP